MNFILSLSLCVFLSKVAFSSPPLPLTLGLGKNFHTVIESEAYRSKNPKLKQLRKYIKEYNIKNCSELEENTQPKSQKFGS